jgi:ABC-type dipeptide/oligopeptide/nickel transport system permease subunit
VFHWRVRTRFVKSRAAMAGSAIVLLLVLFALIGPAFARHGPLESDFARGVSPNGMPVGPGMVFPLGADRLFRDVLARLAYGARISLVISSSATAMAMGIGGLVGIVAGWHEGGRVDGLLMRFVDVMLAFPFLLLVMAVGAALEHTSAWTILVTLGATSWLGIARILRAKTIQVRSREYIVASRALGQSSTRIMAKHVLPNVSGPLLVSGTMLVAQLIMADSVLSYLGVGIPPPAPTWGRMLFDGQDDYATAPWIAVAPGLAILFAVWGFNMLGEGMRDALDPHEV